MSNDSKLIERVVAAIKRETAARDAYNKADMARDDAATELRAAWTALRDYQDEQVKAVLSQDPNNVG